MIRDHHSWEGSYHVVVVSEGLPDYVVQVLKRADRLVTDVFPLKPLQFLS